jgi:hypothetical protein
MGFSTQDVTSLGSQLTATTPVGKTPIQKMFQVARTDTVASVKAIFPADTSIINLVLYANGNSNAGTSSAVTFNIKRNGATISTGTVNTLTSGNTTALVQMSALPNLVDSPLGSDITIEASIAESGTASSTGGPWKVMVESVR